jgi:RNA recognition motif-containing protein
MVYDDIITFFVGFLDGGDRNMLLDSRSPPISLSRGTGHDNSDIADANSSASSIDSAEHDLAAFALSLVPTPTIFVTNLPTFLFSQVQDMQSLFYPFGHIKKLKILGTSPKGSTSAIIEYESAGIAQEARETLHGQCYAGQQISVRFVRSKSSLLDLASVSDTACYDMNAPHAFSPSARQSPFLLGPAGLHSHYDSIRSQRFNNTSRYTRSGSQNTYLHAPHHLSLHGQRTASRSSSASSW